MATANVLAYGFVVCKGKGVSGVSVKVQLIDKDGAPLKDDLDPKKNAKAQTPKTNSRGLWAATFSTKSAGAIDGVKVIATCPDGKERQKRYKGAALRSSTIESLGKLIRNLYDIRKDKDMVKGLKLVLDQNFYYKITGSRIECCPVAPVPKKKKSENAAVNDGLGEQFVIELAGQAADEGALRVNLDGTELIATFDKADSAHSTLRTLADDLAAVGFRVTSPFPVAADTARLLLSGPDGDPIRGGRLNLDAGLGLKTVRFAAECYCANEFLIGDSSGNAFVGEDAGTLVLHMRERATGTRHDIEVASKPLEDLADRLLATLPVDEVATAAAAGGIVLTVLARGQDTLLIEGITVHGNSAQVLSVSDDDLTAGEIVLSDAAVTELDGIGDATATALADVGIFTLTDLRAAAPGALAAAGLNNQRALKFRAMADILLAFPTLTSDDAEVVVAGFGVSSGRELLARRGELTRERIMAAAGRVGTTGTLNPERLLSL